MAKQRSTKAKPATTASPGRAPDPDGYYCWLIGKGFAPANAMRMVEAKFGTKTAHTPTLGWAWKG